MDEAVALTQPVSNRFGQSVPSGPVACCIKSFYRHSQQQG